MTPSEILAAWDECSNIPETAIELERVLGNREKAAVLISRFPGSNLPVPLSNTNKSKYWVNVVSAIGENSAALLIKEFGGDKIYIPTCKSMERSQFNKSIVKEYEDGCYAGKSHNQICLEMCMQHGVAVRTIERIVNRPVEERS
jgi:hypothetical protein